MLPEAFSQLNIHQNAFVPRIPIGDLMILLRSHTRPGIGHPILILISPYAFGISILSTRHAALVGWY